MKPPKAIVTVATVAVLGYAAVCGVMFLKQESFIFFPERALAATPADAGLAFEPLRLRTSDGATIGAWWIPAEPARGALVFAHGNGGNRSHRLAKVRLLHDLGLSVLAFDYRGYGDSDGRPSERGTYRDMDAAIDFVTGERGVPPARVVYMGESLGGAVAVEAAARRPAGGLIVESSFTSVPAMARRYYPWLPVRLLLTVRYDSLARIRGLTCPVLVLHSPDDDVVPYEMGRELCAAAPEPKAFAELAGGHNGGGITASPAARRALAAFLAGALGR